MISNRFSVLIVLTACFNHGLDGSTLSFDNGNFHVSWRYEKDHDELHFELNVKTEGWVGFGFTFTPKKMNNYDVIIGGKTRAGTPYLNDFFTVGLTTPVLDLKQSYMLDMASKQDGITTLHFHRPRITSDSEDIQFNMTTSVFILWAYNKIDDARDPSSFSKHSRKGYSSEPHRIVVEAIPTVDVSSQDSTKLTTFHLSTPPLATLKPAKALGFQLNLSTMTIAIVFTLNLFVQLVLK